MKVSEDLRKLFEFVLANNWTTAREAGKSLNKGKSRANHYFYGYEGILFSKRGLAPPRWNVVSIDALDLLNDRIIPTASKPMSSGTKLAPAQQAPDRERPIFSAANSMEKRPDGKELPPIAICTACDLPIQPNLHCGCS
jgi:hypothetical protein